MYGLKHVFMPISTVLKLILRRKHVMNLSHHTKCQCFIHIGVEILLWCCIWSCRRCGWACPGRTGSTRPCHWRWSSLHTAGTARCTSLVGRERKRSGEAGDRRLNRILGGLCSQTPQSSQHAISPVWNSEGWNLPGWLVTAMITNITWRQDDTLLRILNYGQQWAKKGWILPDDGGERGKEIFWFQTKSNWEH